MPELGGDTAIAQIVQIRTEKNKEVLKRYTPEQRQIRNKWLAKFVETEETASKDKDKMVVEFFKMFSKKGV